MTSDEIGRLARTLEKIGNKVDGLADGFARMEQKMEDRPTPGEGVSCKIHEGKIKSIEQVIEKVAAQQDKQNLIAMALSAATAAILMAGKWLIGK